MAAGRLAVLLSFTIPTPHRAVSSRCPNRDIFSRYRCPSKNVRQFPAPQAARRTQYVKKEGWQGVGLSFEVRTPTTFQLAYRTGKRGKRKRMETRRGGEENLPAELKGIGLPNWPEILRRVELDDGFGWEFPAASLPFITTRLENLGIEVTPLPSWVLAMAGKYFRGGAVDVVDGIDDQTRIALMHNAPSPPDLRQSLTNLMKPRETPAFSQPPPAEARDSAWESRDSTKESRGLSKETRDSMQVSRDSLEGPVYHGLDPEVLRKLKKTELVEMAREYGLKLSGNKTALVSRLLTLSVPPSDRERISANFDKISENLDKTSEYLDETSKNLVKISENVDPSLRPVDKKEFVEPSSLMEYQLAGVRFGIQSNGRILLGDEMGLGKTVQALMIALYYRQEWPVLVITPATLRGVWVDHIQTWLGACVGEDEIYIPGRSTSNSNVPATAKFVICSYDLLARHKHLRQPPRIPGFLGDPTENTSSESPDVSGRAYNIVICDESHYIKSPDAKRTKAAVAVLKAARRAILLTGTPLQNRAAELYTQLDAILPNLLPGFEEYAERYCGKSKRVFGWGRYQRSQTIWEGSYRPEELHTLLTSSVMLRRRKADVLSELPPKIRHKVPLDGLDPKQLKQIKVEMEKYRAELNSAAKGETDRAVGRLSGVYQMTAEAKLDAVCAYVSYLLENTDAKLLVFGHHRLVLDGIEDSVSGQTELIRIDGQTPVDQRHGLAVKFQKDSATRVALLSVTAAGTGLTLHAATVVIFSELFWVPGQLIQCEDRAHRHGQRSSVDVQYLVAPGTIDDILWPMLNRKLASASATLDGGITPKRLA